MDLRDVLDRELPGKAVGTRRVALMRAPWLNVADARATMNDDGEVVVQWHPTNLSISRMPALEWVRIRGQDLDVSLGSLPALQQLDVEAHTLVLHEPLRNVRRAALGVRRLVGLDRLPGVEHLSLAGQFPELARLAPRSLRIACELHEVVVRRPKELVELHLRDARNIAGIERFSNLVRLDLHGSRVDDLEPLTRLEHLRILDVRTLSASLSPLTRIPSLRAIAAQRSDDIPAAILPIVTHAEGSDLPVLAARNESLLPLRDLWDRVSSLVLSHDLDEISVGCDALAEAHAVASFDWLLQGVSVWNLRSGHLHPEPEARAFHLHALLRLIALAPAESVGRRIRDELDRVEVWFSPKSEAPVDLSVFVGFPKLRSLTLHRITRIHAVPEQLDIAHVELGFAPEREIPGSLRSLAPEIWVGHTP